jgi:CheY-like chemotaxis protein
MVGFDLLVLGVGISPRCRPLRRSGGSRTQASERARVMPGFVTQLADAHCRGMDAGCSLEAPSRDALLGLATVCALVACATISGMRPTVLIVDDHAAFRASARALLQAEGFDIVGEAADGVGAVEAVAVLRPEIVLLDIQLPDLDGLAVAEQLAAVPDAPAVVLISSRDAAAYGPRLQATPARGFIPKSGLSGEALAALIG